MQEAEAYRADSLAFVLSQLYGLDQGVRMLGLRGEEVAAIRRADSLTFGQFLAFVSEYGFPTAELVGEDNFSRECVCMLGYVVMLHNPQRLLEPETFRLLCGEVRAGRLNPEVFGWALDRYSSLTKGIPFSIHLTGRCVRCRGCHAAAVPHPIRCMRPSGFLCCPIRCSWSETGVFWEDTRPSCLDSS